MRICHITPSLEVRHGGPSKSVPRLCEALAAEGNDVELATTGATTWSERKNRLSIAGFMRSWPAYIKTSAGLKGHLEATSADVIHHHALWLRCLHYARQAASRLSVPLVISPRGMMDPWAWQHHSWRKGLARALVHPKAFEAAAGWHATSENEARAIADLGFTQPICIAPNGVASPTPEEMQEAREAWTAKLPEVASRPVALFYSRFHKKKRLLETIDLWLENSGKDWLLLVVGIPEDYTPRMVNDYVLRSGNSGRVFAFDGYGLPPPYAVASLFLLGSHSENFGQSIAEALASGVPAVVTTTTPWEGLNSIKAGWCVPWDDFGAALREASSETTESLRQRGERARDWVLGRYSWKLSAEKLIAFYTKLRA